MPRRWVGAVLAVAWCLHAQTRAFSVAGKPWKPLRRLDAPKMHVGLAASSAAAVGGGASLKPFIDKLMRLEHLSSDETQRAWDSILAGADVAQVAAMLVLLRAKGETPAEIAGMVRAMQAACLPVRSVGRLLDIVGTGGDGAHTINISTAAVILAAACGCKVAKAGNRSVSSKCGSADVLEALGVQIDLSVEQVSECLERCGVAFMYAPTHHPSVKNVAPIRKALGVRTAFNMLGPMTNAASAQHVVIGVFDEGLVDLMAGALMELGHIEHGVIVYGVGLDEISPLGPATIFEIKNSAPLGTPKKYETKRYMLDPENLGVPRCVIQDLKGGDATFNANALREVLSAGSHLDARRNAVILNAAMGVYVYGAAKSIDEAMDVARATLQSGAGLQKLEQWIAATKAISSASA